jgi:hypothetical protein
MHRVHFDEVFHNQKQLALQVNAKPVIIATWGSRLTSNKLKTQQYKQEQIKFPVQLPIAQNLVLCINVSTGQNYNKVFFLANCLRPR